MESISSLSSRPADPYDGLVACLDQATGPIRLSTYTGGYRRPNNPTRAPSSASLSRVNW